MKCISVSVSFCLGVCALIVLVTSLFLSACKGQANPSEERRVGGPCQDCEALLDFKVLGLHPAALDTIPGFEIYDPKLKITGRVYQKDGKTPAEDIILYIYQTNLNGIYQAGENARAWENTHGQHRTWLKTGSDGRFTFYTFRPAPYPGGSEAEHIHIYLKEPDTAPYYIDSYFFESDSLLTEERKQSFANRGGSGIIELEQREGMWIAERNIFLGLNIPDYE